MSKRPYFQLYQSDALGGMAGLTPEQRGVYVTFLLMLYDSDWDQGIVDNEALLAASNQCHLRTYRRIRDELLMLPRKLIRIGDGRISNERYLRERAKHVDISGKRKEAGREGGKKSGEARRKAAEDQPDLPGLTEDGTDGESGIQTPMKGGFKRVSNGLTSNIENDLPPELPNEINETDEANAKQAGRARASARVHTQKEEESLHRSRSMVKPANGKPLRLREPDWDHIELAAHFMRLAGVSDISPGSNIAGQNAVRSWLDNSIALDLIEATIIKRRDAAISPIRSLRYFDEAIREAHSRQEHPRYGKPATSIDDISDPVLRRYLADRAAGGVDP